ncbi:MULTISPECIES: AraC family transcriptional regulator [Citrobacter]|uniref:AraC family transcriptional regulator n=1 Tax=Citrobacter TaxID=544 RepID=UPI001F128656|nr:MULTISPECIES: helix-turn-helix domain-containing protein [Citrobacter]
MNTFSGRLKPIIGNRHGAATQLFFAPSEPLRHMVSHYTVQLRCVCEQPSQQPLTIIPDASGCLVFTVTRERVQLLLWGPGCQPQPVTRDFNTIDLRILVEFLPGGAFGLLGGLPLYELQNRQERLGTIAPSLEPLFRPVIELHHDSYPLLLQAIDDALVRHCDRVTESVLMRQILACSSSACGMLRLNALSEMTSYSPRHINRLCQERIGLSWKSFARILRINEACRRINRGEQVLRTLACDLDYHDQAHFTKDFKALSGVTPSDYQRNLSDFYHEETKLCTHLPVRYAPGK